MKLHRKFQLKMAVFGATVGLLIALFGLVRANPQIAVEAEAVEPTPDYNRFFAPQSSPNRDTPRTAPTPHTRTRAS